MTMDIEKCKWCGSTKLKETIMTGGPHYSRIDCKSCGRFVKWGKKPPGEASNKKHNERMGKTMTINEVILAGRLTKDPEVKSLRNGKVCSFTVACDRYMGKDKDNEADFINCIAWNQTAEFVEKYFSKGKKIIVKGNIRTRAWDDNEGKRHWVTEVWVEKVDFADSKKENGSSKASDPAPPPPLPGEYTTQEAPKGQPAEQAAAASKNNNMPPWYQG
jgi:single-strand DNA-binding protein